MPKRQEIIIRIAAVLMSIVFAGLILVIFGLNPLKIFATIIKGSLGTEIRIQQNYNKSYTAYDNGAWHYSGV